MILTSDETNRIRQWFDAVWDCAPDYLDKKDFQLAGKIYTQCGWRIPLSLANRINRTGVEAKTATIDKGGV